MIAGSGNHAFIYRSEADEIARLAQEYPRTETGGDLYGTFTHGGAPAIWLASGPGPGAVHQETQLSQDVVFTTQSQRRLMSRFALQYVGSWHSHHVLSLAHPSNGDEAAARSYLKKHRRETTIEIIVNHTRDGTQLRGYVYRRSLLGRYDDCDLESLTGISPVRALYRSEGDDPFARHVLPSPRGGRARKVTRSADDEVDPVATLPAKLLDLASSLVAAGCEAEYDNKQGHHLLFITAPSAVEELTLAFDETCVVPIRIGSIDRQSRVYSDLTETLRRSHRSDDGHELSFDRILAQLLDRLIGPHVGGHDQ